MSRYFFNFHHEGSRLDTEGVELPNNEAAWREATAVAGELFQNMGWQIPPGSRMAVGSDGRASKSPLHSPRLRRRDLRPPQLAAPGCTCRRERWQNFLI